MKQLIEEQRTNGSLRDYRASRGWKSFLISLAVIAIGGSSAGLWWTVVDGSLTVNGRLLMDGICLVFLLMGVYLFVWPLRAKVILDADCLTSIEVFTRKRIARSAIRGWRIMPTTPPMLRLERKGCGVVKVALTFPVDDTLDNWLEGLPCLDQEDVDAEVNELEADQKLGFTLGQRDDTLKRAKTQARALSIIAVAACLWGAFYPHPYPIAMLVQAVLPWAGVEMTRRWHGVVRIDEKRNQIRPSVALAVMSPGFVLMYRAAIDINIIFTVWAVLAMAATAGVLIAALFRVDPSLKANRGSGIAICALMLAYGYGAVVEANTLLDRKPADIYRTVILGKHVDHGKSTTYYLDPEPWGPEHKARSFEVGGTTFGAIGIGDTANIALRRGALGVQWFYLASWEQGGTQPQR
jgi:hypothetical protein